MVFYDTETIPGLRKGNTSTQAFRLAVGCFWRHRRDDKADQYEWGEFTDRDKLWDWITSKTRSNTNTLLIAHNLSFDLISSDGLEQLKGRGWILTLLYENGLTRIVKWGYPDRKLRAYLDAGGNLVEYKGRMWSKTITGMDNYNLFAGSIEEWGKSLDFPKLKMPHYDASDQTWFPYCKRDVEIMVKLWQEWFAFLDSHDMGTFRLTIGSQAFTAFRHRHMHNKIEIHANETALRLEREAYYGGRTEAFYVGTATDGPFYKLDVNSMYPYVMRINRYPTRLKGVQKTPTRADLEYYLDRYGVIADLTLDTPAPAFPIRENNKNIYPVGTFRTTLSTPEIRYALGNGWIVKVHEIAFYTMRPIFQWYVGAFYKLKVDYEQQGDMLRRKLVKLLLNSLYGKFGQRGYEDRIIGTCDPDEYSVSQGMDATNHLPLTIYRAGGAVIESRRLPEGYNSFVGIAAHVTAYARMYLYRLIATAGQGHCYYCDTDSLFVDRVGYLNLEPYIDPGQLGYLKVEGTSETLEIRAPKDYTFAGHDTRKGIRESATPLGENVYEQEHWRSIKSHISHGQVSGFVNDYVTKHLLYQVDWGEKGDDGWITPYYRGVTPLFI